MEGVDSARVTGLLGWLEEQHHQTKAQVARLQYQIEQLSNLTREQAGQIRTAQEELAAARNQLNRWSVIDETVRQLREVIARLQGTQAEHLQETDKDEKGRQQELERAKQAVNDMWLRIDNVYKEFEPLLGKVQAISDVTKRHQEAVGELFKSTDSLGKQTETLAARLQIANEQGRRNEGETDRINKLLEALQTQDGVATTRLQVLADKVKQVDEQMAAVLAEEQLKLDLNERIQVLRLEQQRLEKAVTNISPMIDIHSVRMDEQARELRQVEERRLITAEEVKELKQVLAEQTARFEGYLIGIEELEERHKRRQVTELELQANEIKGRIAKLKGQVQ